MKNIRIVSIAVALMTVSSFERAHAHFEELLCPSSFNMKLHVADKDAQELTDEGVISLIVKKVPIDRNRHQLPTFCDFEGRDLDGRKYEIFMSNKSDKWPTEPRYPDDFSSPFTMNVSIRLRQTVGSRPDATLVDFVIGQPIVLLAPGRGQEYQFQDKLEFTAAARWYVPGPPPVPCYPDWVPGCIPVNP